MEDGQMKLLYKTLDDVRHQNGVEYWYARELYPILGYARWENFETAIARAKESCATSGTNVADHFTDVTKTVATGNGAEKQIKDLKLSRYACYLIALNGDPQKEEVAFAQAYFVSQTRTMEVLMQKMLELARLDAREKLKATEKDFANAAFTRGVDGPGIARVKSAGDRALFGGKNTEDMKHTLGVPTARPLADYLPDVTLKAKDLATAMTTENVRRENLQGEHLIKNNHVASNENVRGALTKSGIFPERLPASEDIKQVESRHRLERKQLQKKQKAELAQATEGTSK